MTSQFADDGDVALVQSPYDSLDQNHWLNVTYSLAKNDWDRYTSIRIQRIDKDDWITELDVIEESTGHEGVWAVCLPTGDYSLAFRAVIGLSESTDETTVILPTVSSLSDVTVGDVCTYSGPDVANTEGKCY